MTFMIDIHIVVFQTILTDQTPNICINQSKKKNRNFPRKQVPEEEIQRIVKLHKSNTHYMICDTHNDIYTQHQKPTLTWLLWAKDNRNTLNGLRKPNTKKRKKKKAFWSMMNNLIDCDLVVLCCWDTNKVTFMWRMLVPSHYHTNLDSADFVTRRVLVSFGIIPY